MPVIFDPSWQNYTLDAFKLESNVNGLIRSAAYALSEDTNVEMIWWRDAAGKGLHVLEVTKGLHQPEGVSSKTLHLTMRLHIPGSKAGSLVPNTHFKGKFHLYADLLQAKQGDVKRKAVPTRLTYQTGGAQFQGAKGYLSVSLSNATIVSFDVS